MNSAVPLACLLFRARVTSSERKTASELPVLVRQPANFLQRFGHVLRHLFADTTIEHVRPVAVLADQRDGVLVALYEDVPPEDGENDRGQQQNGDDPVDGT